VDIKGIEKQVAIKILILDNNKLTEECFIDIG
jgi:hypothetical protein